MINEEQNNSKKKVLSTVLKWLWSIAIIVFVAYYLYHNYDTVVEIISKISPVFIFLSACMLFIVKILLVLNMHLAVRVIDKKLSFFKSYYIYNISQLGKYIPGNFWHFVGKIGYLKGEGFTGKEIRNAIFLELGFIIAGSVVFGIIFVIFNPVFIGFLKSALSDYYIYLIVGGAIVFVAAAVFIALKFSSAIRSLKSFLKKWKLLYKVAITQFFIWIIQGLSFYFIIYNYMDSLTIPYVIGLYSLGYIIGFVFPLAPAGIGIREFIIVSGLTIAGIPEAVSISLVGLHRIVYIFVEVILAVIGVSFKSKLRS